MKGLVFTYLLTYVGGFIGLFSPLIGFFIYVCFSIIRPEWLWHWAVQPGNYSRIVGGLMLAGWALRGFGDWRFGRATGIVAALLGYFSWSMVASACSPQPEVSWPFVIELAKIVLPFLVGMTMICSVAQLRALVWVIVLSQGYVAFDMNLSYYSGFNEAEQIGFGMGRASFAIGLVASIGPAAFLGLYAERLWQKALAFGCAVLILNTILLSFSRGGMLALVVAALVGFVVLPKKPTAVATFLLALLVGLRLAGTEVTERFTSIAVDAYARDASAQGRIELWKDNWTVMMEDPLVGVGPDRWPVIAPRFGWPQGKEAHSLWLQTGAEQGIPGVLLLGLFYALTTIQLLPLTRLRGTGEEAWLRCFAAMVVTSIAGFAVAAQFVTIEGLELPYYVVLIGACTLRLHGALSASPAKETARMMVASGPRVLLGTGNVVAGARTDGGAS